MTRRGSLVYYLAAWVCGCFFASVALWILLPFGGVRGFLSVYFFSLFWGFLPALLFALVLRLFMDLWKWKHSLAWLLPGGALAPLMLLIYEVAERALGWADRRDPIWVPVYWSSVPVGAATAFVLSLIHRAFEPRPESPQPGL